MSVCDVHLEGRVIDAATQAARGARLAGGLRRLGLQEGDVVAVLLRNDAAYIDVVHACRQAGIAYCPVNWHFTAEEVAFLLRDSGAKALLAQGELLDAVAAALPGEMAVLAVGQTRLPQALAYEPWLAAQPPYDGPVVSPRAHMAYTSGTTGRPKGVVRAPIPVAELQARQAHIRQLVALSFGLTPGCRALLPAPLYHSAPSVFLQNALLVAERLVLMARFDAEALLAAIERHRIEVVYLVPIMYVRLLRLPEAVRQRYDISTLRFVASTGAPCAPEVKRAMIEWFGPVIHETYASSEAGMVTAISAVEALARPGSAGQPLLDAQVRILDEEGRALPTGEVGLIYVRQPAYPDFTYRHNDEARQAVERDGLVSLGDMGYLDADGYLYVCDRASDMVISGGVNIYPAEIEHRLLAFPGVADCAVFGVPDAEYGERLHAVVEAAAGTALQPASLREWLQGGLSSFKVPRSIEIAPLPRDDNGKIAKRRLREQHWQGQARRV
ncbi:AMP-binding protein [Variovorax sp. JS1663]|uniref:AMP-binding protein n=1 Tax=Variovorax sp. JS1663 TaxID=1851577 RepID=UPI000B343A6A|nr:AMP-binding protein [Variovorax sp. JS1663]OUL99741.1 long-chain fatty acid--CoA ligase [Variovorax sp. JS1663]